MNTLRKISPSQGERLLYNEKVLNSHCTEWGKMFNSGKNLGHLSRIIISKTTTSNNEADMYILYKDHKKEADKTRPLVTGCTSNTLGMSNNVSDLLEAVANSEPDPYEVISSEDMLAATKKFNEIFMERRDNWLEKRNFKIMC